jgi:hypothetical protein
LRHCVFFLSDIPRYKSFVIFSLLPISFEVSIQVTFVERWFLLESRPKPTLPSWKTTPLSALRKCIFQCFLPFLRWRNSSNVFIFLGKPTNEQVHRPEKKLIFWGSKIIQIWSFVGQFSRYFEEYLELFLMQFVLKSTFIEFSSVI